LVLNTVNPHARTSCQHGFRGSARNDARERTVEVTTVMSRI